MNPMVTGASRAPSQVKLLDVSGTDQLALVYALQLGPDDRFTVETVDSVDPRYPRRDKTVIILSTQFGCPVACPICDAGGGYRGDLSAGQMLAQVQFVLSRRREAILESAKLKVHFARMGEPALNGTAVLSALSQLRRVVPSSGLMPCIATVAPAGSEWFFDELRWVKRRFYGGGHFQLQLSINTTDAPLRRRLIPLPHLELETLAQLGARFFDPGDRKVALNFALASGVPLSVERLAALFDPERFMIKLTPVNPTLRARRAGLETVLSAEQPEAAQDLVERLGSHGFDVVVSIGEAEEIAIGSNCGQLVRARRWRS